MKRVPRLLLALLAPAALVWSSFAAAQNCTNGNNLYHKQVSGALVGCANSSCHGNDPKNNMNGILDSGQQANGIQAALDSVSEMSGLGSPGGVYGPSGLTGSDLDDLALYIWYRAGNQSCPAPGPAVSANPTSAAFGNVNVGSSSAPQTITITNNGSGAASSMVYPAAPTGFTKSGTCASSTLGIGASCTVIFTFSPGSAGAFNPTYTITGSGGTNVPISLSGTGVSASAPNVTAAPTTLAYGNVNVGSTSSPQTVTVSNTGTAAATNMTYPAAPAKFNKSGTCSSATLNPGSSCTVIFTYSPTTAVADNATYTITGGGATLNINLSGTGTAAASAALTALPGSISFGSVAVGSTSPTQTLTIGNTGGAQANAISMSNGNSAEFLVTGSNCGASLAPGASCSMNVAYKPSGAGADNANLNFTYTGGAPVVVSLSGTGTAAATANLVVAPPTLSFGSITVNSTSAAQTITVSNTGTAQATGIAFANSNAPEFVVSANGCGATLNAGASCTLNVAYAPNGAGADSATLTVNSSGGSPVVSLSGTGTSAASPSLSAAPPIAAFGNVNVGQSSSPITVTVNNTGTGMATGIAMANSNAAEFVVSGSTCGATLNPGASCTLTVTYTPSGAGSDSATLTWNYAGGGSLSVSMSGAGTTVAPPPGTGQLSMVASVAMPDTTLGTSSAPRAVTLSNTGTVAVSVTSITSSNAGEFAVGGSTCGSVAAGAACSFNLTFAPSAAGARSATVTIASNGNGSPQSIAVSGTGLSGGTTPPPANVVAAIEYYHAGFDHYFITSINDEVVKLDNGTFVGWTRTGRQFNVNQAIAQGLQAVCRFFSTAFGPKSSHFYTPDAPECATVKANPNWQFEAEVFFTTAPALDGSCPANADPVYRVYNNGLGGAPNHRYTTDLAVRAQMLALGWIAEGYGPIGVIMCAPK